MNQEKSPSLFSRLSLTSDRKKARLSSNRKPQTTYESLEPRKLMAAIIWSSGNITGDTVVSTNGSSVFALNASNGTGVTTTVNGVDFVTSTRANATGTAQGQSVGSESIVVTTIANDNGASFEDGNLGNVGDLIEGGWWGTDTGNSATITLTGLTVGDVYELQIFSNDARDSRDNGNVTRIDGGPNGTGVDLELNNQPNGGLAGDFGIGTFTANGSTQSIELEGLLDGVANQGRLQVNAIQLRNLGATSNTPSALFAIDLGNSAGVDADLATFQAADPNLDSSTTLILNGGAWDGNLLNNTYSGLTFSTLAGDNQQGTFQASRAESYATDLPLLDSYTFGRSDRTDSDELELDISGFAAFAAGQTITLTAWGIGDQVGQQTEFTSVFGSTSVSQSTFYGTNDAGNGSVPFVQFTFVTDGITDQLSLTPRAGGTTPFIPINGISLSVAGPSTPLLPGPHPIINEFSASNSNTLDDDNGNSTDYIELFNAGDTALDLAGYTLTDDADEIDKYVLPSTTLGAGQFLIVFAGDDTDPTSGTDLFTGFSLSSSGEYLGFFDPAGNLISEFGPNGTDFPEQFTDVSFGLVADGNFDTSSFFATPTPGAANVNPVEGVTSRVNSSVTPGFYTGTISVELTTETAGADIYFTTDGSTPSATNGTLYNGAIDISSTTNLRAVSVLDNFLSDFDRTYSYLFVSDILDQTPATTEAAGFPDEDNRPNGGNLDYGIDPQVLSIEGRQAVEDALLSISSISITTDLENLFDPATGIYANPRESGRLYERPASVELLNPDGSEGFQVNAGIRIRGGFSRRNTNPKHSFRLFFRSEYGDPALNYPLHGENNVDTFQNLDLRTAQNYSYSSEGDASNTFINEVISRQNQGLSALTTQSTWAHLYINGQYWGLYQTQERAEADFAASYLGGDADDYDVVAPDGGIGASRFIQATDGNTDAYFRLFDQANALAPDNSTPAFVDNDAYLKAQGLNPDGTRNPDYEVLLDVDNLITYITEIWYSGNFDSGITRFGGSDSLNNFQAIRDRTGDEGFRFFVHDAEHSLRDDNRDDVNIDRTIPQNDEEFDNARSFNPVTLHQRLMANAEYRLAFADSIQEDFFNGGNYTTENIIARWDAEADQIRSAIIAESARWGDAQRDFPLLQSDWENAIANTREDFLALRNDIFLDQLRETIIGLRAPNGDFQVGDGIQTQLLPQDAPLFPSIEAPAFAINGAAQHGGTIEAGDTLTFTENSSVFFTTDGSDPRLFGGTVNPSAQFATTGIALNSSAIVQARSFSINTAGEFEWSPLLSATFTIPASQSDLRISEIHFNPSDPTASELAISPASDNNDDFEFIEIFNSNTTGAINLNGIQITEGVQYVRSGDFLLQPGERVVIVEDIAAFEARYGTNVTVLDQWLSGGLSNSGEEITLADSAGDEIQSVNYGDGDPWAFATDGVGFSLVLDDPVNTPVEELGKYYSWRASTEFGGTPGEASADPIGVVINEVLAHTDLPQSDTIELFNTTSAAIDVSGWFLSDDGANLLQFQIPAGTVIAAGGYLTFDESDFNVGGTGFALSSNGDRVFLSEGLNGAFVGLQDSVEFSATFNGESLGRLPDGTGRLTRQAATSFGSVNGQAEVGPLVISEINYHPAAPSAAALAIDSTLVENELEYIEIANPTNSTIDLTDWRIRGEADFDFAAGTSLAAGEAIVVVTFDPINAAKLAAFRAQYGIGSDVVIVGGLSEALSNSFGRVSLQQPDAPDVLGEIPHVVVDEVVYDDLAPFPDADGNGLSLQRDDFDASGNLATSWTAEAPTPGEFESPFLLGDVTQNGVVDFLDIAPFISLLQTGGFLAEADIDQSGTVDFLDISPFIALLSSPPSSPVTFSAVTTAPDEAEIATEAQPTPAASADLVASVQADEATSDLHTVGLTEINEATFTQSAVTPLPMQLLDLPTVTTSTSQAEGYANRFANRLEPAQGQLELAGSNELLDTAFADRDFDVDDFGHADLTDDFSNLGELTVG